MDAKKETEKEIEEIRLFARKYVNCIQDDLTRLIRDYENKIEYLIGEVAFFRHRNEKLTQQLNRILDYVDDGDSDMLKTKAEREMFTGYLPYGERK